MARQLQRDDELNTLRQRAGIATRRGQELVARMEELLAKSKVLADEQSVDWGEWKSWIEVERATLTRFFGDRQEVAFVGCPAVPATFGRSLQSA